MGKTKPRGRGQRAATATPQSTKPVWKTVVDLTSDPHSISSSAPIRQPTALSPAFGSKTNTTIEVPSDPKMSPAYLFQQMALMKNRANVRPSFSSTIHAEPDHGSSSDVSSEDKENTPTPRQRKVKDNPQEKPKEIPGKQTFDGAQDKDKAANRTTNVRGKDKGASQAGKDDARLEQQKDKSKTEQEGEPNSIETPSKKSKPKKKRKARDEEEEHEGSSSHKRDQQKGPKSEAGKSKKRKRNHDDDEHSKMTAEAQAIKLLRETLPGSRLSRVRNQLVQALGCDPTELTVLVTTARDTIIDLAKQQVAQTERSYNAIQAELLGMLKEQNERLERFEGRAKAAIEARRSTPDSDSSSDSELEVSEEEQAPKRHKSRGRGRTVSPVSVRRRASTTGPHSRSAGCQDYVQ